MIKIENLSVSYGKGLPDIITNMSFELQKGCILNILGQNAVGKTTLIRTLMRELQGYSGSVMVKGNEVGTYSIKEYAKIMGVVSTSFNTSQNLIVADYLVTGFINQMSPFSKPDSNYVKKAYEILSSFGKHELFNKHIKQLSSGERQIVMIARVLLQNPEIIIVDEPTANLDVKNQIAVLNQIKKLSEQGYTVIVTTHNPGHAYAVSPMQVCNTMMYQPTQNRAFYQTNNSAPQEVVSMFCNGICHCVKELNEIVSSNDESALVRIITLLITQDLKLIVRHQRWFYAYNGKIYLMYSSMKNLAPFLRELCENISRYVTNFVCNAGFIESLIKEINQIAPYVEVPYDIGRYIVFNNCILDTATIFVTVSVRIEYCCSASVTSAAITFYAIGTDNLSVDHAIVIISDFISAMGTN